MAPDDPAPLLSIGEFARRSRLSAKALRRYDELGILPPAVTDPANGYRWYRDGQLRAAGLVKLLRGIDVPLAAIGPFLADVADDPERAARRLDEHLAVLDARHADRRALVRHLHAAIREDPDPMFPVQTRHVPATPVLSITRHLTIDEADGFLADAWDAFHAHLGSAAPTGPFTVLVHGVVDDESDGPMEAIVACPAGTAGTEAIAVRVEPAHDEAYTTITKAQWDFPAILAAYDAVGSSPEVAARPGSPLACREVYAADPRSLGPDDVICDVAFPLGAASKMATGSSRSA